LANSTTDYVCPTVSWDPRCSQKASSPIPVSWSLAGSLQSVESSSIGISVTREKWEKGHNIVRDLVKECLGEGELPNLLHKKLEKERGFLVHLGMTFESIVPFLKGIHLTLDQWQLGRETGGWARSDKDHREWMHHFYHSYKGREDHLYEIVNAGAPLTVLPVPRLLDDLVFLQKFFEPTSPPMTILRADFIFLVVYGFGDASGKGFGSTFSRGKDISYRIGAWGDDESDESSIWREFTNVVESLEEEAECGQLTNTVVFFFTDNSTAEASLYKGPSKRRKLFSLVIRVKFLRQSTISNW
jgi:hypothetical protein